MNKFAKEWIAALRSGDYKQGMGQLHNPNTDCYCALGVAAKLFAQNNTPIQGDPHTRFDGLRFILSHDVYDKLGLYDDCGRPASEDLGLTPIPDLNDKERWTFDQIADHLEAHAEAYFRPEPEPALET